MLDGVRVVTLAPNVPGPVAAARLRALGATVTKIEPPAGDPLVLVAPRWYAELHAGMDVVRIDLKTLEGRAALDARLEESDALLTSSRLSALERLGLGWQELHSRFPRLVHVAIVGHAPPDDELAGHDLNYVGALGLIEPPAMPRTLVADLAGAERAAGTLVALLYQRERTGRAERGTVSLREAARVFGAPLAHGLTGDGGPLGGGQGVYGIYRASDGGWLAVAALEPHFAGKIARLVGNGRSDPATLRAAFAERSVADWIAWALENDLPISAIE